MNGFYRRKSLIILHEHQLVRVIPPFPGQSLPRRRSGTKNIFFDGKIRIEKCKCLIRKFPGGNWADDFVKAGVLECRFLFLIVIFLK